MDIIKLLEFDQIRNQWKEFAVTVSGCAPIQVSGIIQPIYDEEEEEEEEDLNENQGKEKENQEEGK